MTMPCELLTTFARNILARSRRALTLGAVLSVGMLLAGASAAWAQRELKVIPDPDPELLERRSFQVADGLEVNLYASDPRLAKPIQINFDAQGRLWVASSEVYPHVKPGQEANDKIIVLEDADGDGRAEKSTVFADGLLIPTGVVPGDNGAYVANSTELIHLRDTDGDGRADSRRVMLSGFGTEDTHHILHTLRWGHDGMLYFNQSIYIHSHIETPHGVRRLNSGGIWQFRPETMQLEVFSRGLCNPWGHIFDRWGQSFATDGAGGEGINFLFPGATMFTYAGATKILKGLNPGSPKHCGLEVISGRHFPDEWQGNLVTNDFRAHRVCRFVLTETGAGYSSREQREIIKTTHAAFRPIDAKMGPDGALYIADWYNPIIQHGEVDFRDERRDHTHGRIWRVTVKGRPLVDRPHLVGASVRELLDNLRAGEDFTRLHARLQLKRRSTEAIAALNEWVQGLAAADPAFEELRLEALWTYQALDTVEPQLLGALLHSKDHHVRAAATRVLSAWHFRIPQADSLLTALVVDEHPQVRLEAVRALGQLGTAQAAQTAMRAFDQPMDRFLDHALWLTARDLQSAWLPAIEAAQIDFAGDIGHLTYALQAADSPAAVRPLMDLVRQGKLSLERQESFLPMIAAHGGPRELRVLFDMALDDNRPPQVRARLMAALANGAQMRKAQPEGDLEVMASLLDASDEPLRLAAIRAAGLWQIAMLGERIKELASASDSSDAVRRAALESLAAMGAGEALIALCKPDQSQARRVMAIAAMAALDARVAARNFLVLASEPSLSVDISPIILGILDRKDGATSLAGELREVKLPADVAKLAIRAVRSAAREEPALVAALSAAGGITGPAPPLLPAELGKLAEEVAAKGDPARGEAVFRRAEQSCLKCHAIAGAGGGVGPDLVSIGASAQIDYLIESILKPSAKIKENYHSLVVVVNGRVYTGVKVRETDKELVLRNIEDREVAVSLEAIEEKGEGGSLMPVGLADDLTRGELVDLARFLSALGKVGPYAVDNARVVRRWQALMPGPEATARLSMSGSAAAFADESGITWTSVYSQVSGNLPLAAVPEVQPAESGGAKRVVRCQLDVTTAGKVDLVVSGPIEKMWLGASPLSPRERVTVDLPADVQTITLLLGAQSADDVRLELADVPGSAAQVQIVGGK